MKFEMFKNNSHMKKSPSKFWNTRGKKIVEKLSRPRFFPGFEISRPFSHLRSTEKRAGNFKSRKKSWF